MGQRPSNFSLPANQLSDPVQDSITSFILKFSSSIPRDATGGSRIADVRVASLLDISGHFF
ncbi:MAG: hypothetical protein KAJ45_07025 [Desulfobulbaceae bacterium]|nr:hypothetical protein [Desulfobulbaceae bacterium]